MAHLEYTELDVLKTILAHHGLADDQKLLERLEIFAEWIRDIDQAKFNKYGFQPQYPLVLLSLMGIHGRDALT